MKRLLTKSASKVIDVDGNEVSIDDILQGDLVDFGSYGRLYVNNPNYSENMFWVTDSLENRNDWDAAGWSIKKELAKEVVQRVEDADDFVEYDEDII